MTNENRSLLTTTAACLALGVILGLSISVVVGDEPANWTKSGGHSDWLGFWGSIIGATATIVAGVMAWMAVRRQIDREDARAEEEKNEVSRAFISQVRGLLIDMKMLWAQIDIAMNYTEYNDKAISNAIIIASMIVKNEQSISHYIKVGNQTQTLDDADIFINELEPIKRVHARNIIRVIRKILDNCTKAVEGRSELSMFVVRTAIELSALRKHCEGFGGELSGYFSSHIGFPAGDKRSSEAMAEAISIWGSAKIDTSSPEGSVGEPAGDEADPSDPIIKQ